MVLFPTPRNMQDVFPPCCCRRFLFFLIDLHLKLLQHLEVLLLIQNPTSLRIFVVSVRDAGYMFFKALTGA